MDAVTVFGDLTIDQATLLHCLYRLRQASNMARTRKARLLIESSIHDLEDCLPVHLRRETRVAQLQRIAQEAAEADYKRTAGDDLPF